MSRRSPQGYKRCRGWGERPHPTTGRANRGGRSRIPRWRVERVPGLSSRSVRPPTRHEGAASPHPPRPRCRDRRRRAPVRYETGDLHRHARGDAGHRRCGSRTRRGPHRARRSCRGPRRPPDARGHLRPPGRRGGGQGQQRQRRARRGRAAAGLGHEGGRPRRRRRPPRGPLVRSRDRRRLRHRLPRDLGAARRRRGRRAGGRHPEWCRRSDRRGRGAGAPRPTAP